MEKEIRLWTDKQYFDASNKFWVISSLLSDLNRKIMVDGEEEEKYQIP